MDHFESVTSVVGKPSRPDNWQKEYSAAIRDPGELARILGLPAEVVAQASVAVGQFPLRVPQSYLARMSPGDLDDPLLRQVLPLDLEERVVPGFTLDAVGDAESRVAPGLLAKYHGRALLISTGQCAVHCRYCFRRYYPYDDEPRSQDDWNDAFSQIEKDTGLSEVILSGGDPLTLGDARLETVVDRLARIDHITRLRIHSRLPIVLPSRCTPRLLQMMTETRLKVVVVVHANHARELVADCADALRQMVSAGLMVLNQTVLLRGVNDSAEALIALSERLIDLGV